jgi:hypothetical protein
VQELCARRARLPAAEARFVRPQGGTTVRTAVVVSAFSLAACSRGQAPPPAAAAQPPSPAGVSDTLRDSVAKSSVDTARRSRFVVWRGDTMWVRLVSGDSMSFVNDSSNECCGVSNRFLGTLPSGHLVVETAYEDGISVSVIEPRDGRTVKVSAEPIPSPSGHFFATGDEDALSDELVTVWRLDTTGAWVEDYDEPQGGDYHWAPHQLHWLDDSTLIYVVGQSGSDTGVVYVERRGGHWRHREP